MKGEIDNDFYCVTGCLRIGGLVPGKCYGAENRTCRSNDCPACHRKYPTPEQYKEEHGEEYPDEGAVYFKRHNDTHWAVGVWDTVRKFNQVDYITICACTPFGKPGKDWRP